MFADKSYYYVTYSNSLGKRIQENQQPAGTPNITFSQFDDTLIYEKDLVNAGKVGRRWFGEQFDINEFQTFDFNIPNLDISQPIQLKVNTASRSFGNSSFNIKANNVNLGTPLFPQLDSGSGIEGYESALNTVFNSTSSVISASLLCILDKCTS